MIIANNIKLKYFLAIKKPIGQPGIIVDQQHFRNNSISDKMINIWRNYQTLSDMQRQLSDFSRKKSLSIFIKQNNQLIQNIKNKKLRDLQLMLNDNLLKQIKTIVKNSQQFPSNYNLFPVKSVKIVQARSYVDSIVRLKSIDQWYQLTLQYQNSQNNKKVYHVIQRFYKQKKWKFIKFNL